jgi:hypothetical protein
VTCTAGPGRQRRAWWEAVRSFVLGVLPLCLGLWLGAWSCGPSHCGYNAGDATCAGRDASAPYCNLCVGHNDGCVATPPSDAGCVLVTDSGIFDPTVVPPETEGTTVAPTTGPGPGPSPSTGAPQTDTSSSTTTPVDPDTSSSTTDVTTEALTGASETTLEGTSASGTESTGSSSTTADESTGPPPPMCGNGVLEGMELCDGAALDDQECVDFPGKGGGTLACTQMCQFDLAGCCLANDQACEADGECCTGNCQFVLAQLKTLCRP